MLTKRVQVNYFIADLLINFKLNNSSNSLILSPVTFNTSIYHIKNYLMKISFLRIPLLIGMYNIPSSCALLLLKTHCV